MESHYTTRKATASSESVPGWQVALGWIILILTGIACYNYTSPIIGAPIVLFVFVVVSAMSEAYCSQE